MHSGATLDVEAGAIPALVVVAQSQQEYDARWNEVEAYRLAEGVEPPAPR